MLFGSVTSLPVFIFPTDFIKAEQELKFYLKIFGALCDEKAGAGKVMTR